MWGEAADVVNATNRGKDYPHQCGEKLCLKYVPTAGAGLPPPVWGEGGTSFRYGQYSRITPTSVGRRIESMPLRFYA